MFLPDDGAQPDLKAHFMLEALRQAEKALERDEVPIGVVIVHNRRVIAKAFNQTNLLKDPTAHAEMIAITQAAAHLQHSSGRLLDTELYATVEPCPMCMGAIIQARIPRVFYGAPNEKYGACGSVVNLLKEGRWNHSVTVEKGVLAAEAAALMQGFFRAKRAKLAGD
jgi:tRNA(adenine34) deaminase